MSDDVARHTQRIDDGIWPPDDDYADRVLARRLIRETLYGVNECDDPNCEGCQEFYQDCEDAADSILAAFDQHRLTIIDLGDPVTPEQLRDLLRERRPLTS